MTNWRKKRRLQSGYPMSTLVGLEEARAVIWRIFSRAVKLYTTVECNGKDKRNRYNFYESIVDALRPVFKEGIRTIVVTAPVNTPYTKEFLDHIQRHHLWLVKNKDSIVTIGELTGSADQLHEVSKLVKSQEFRKILPEVMSEDADRIIDTLEKHLNEIDSGTTILYSTEEIEKLIDSLCEQTCLKPGYLILTNQYLTETKEKRRIQRLLQIAKNKKVKTKIVNIETKAGNRLNQLGGIVYLARTAVENTGAHVLN